MEESILEPAAEDLLIELSKVEPPPSAENATKEQLITMTTEAMGPILGSDVRDASPSSNGAADSSVSAKASSSLEEEEEAKPTPQESSLSPENETLTIASTEEESFLRTEGGMAAREKRDLCLDIDETSSVLTTGISDNQRDSLDSASFSIPSLELSDGVTAIGNSLDVDRVPPPLSAPVEETVSQSAELPGLRDGEAAEAAGEAAEAAGEAAEAAGERAEAAGEAAEAAGERAEAAGEAAEAAGGAVAFPQIASTSTAATESEPTMPAYYLVKWITWKEKKTPIITQSENGPCPLLAIMNTLFLRWKAKLPALTEVVTTEDLMAHLGECVLSVTPREKADGMDLNFQQNMSDAMAVLPKLSTGLDVNVRFTGVTDFEYTPECIVFDLLDIPLYHGWLVDPQSPEMVASVGKLSYNQLVEKIIDYKHSADSSRVSEGLIAEQFLESTATQLSYHGLCELNTTVKEGEISVFFRNNHFSTMIKHKGHLYLLVTDQGFLQEEGLVWESLHNVEGDGNFCDSDFRLCHPPQRAPPTTAAPPGSQEQQRQIDQDYLVAVSLQQQQGGAPGPLSDLELARQLQQEEYQQQQQQQQQQQEQQQQQQQPQQQQVRGGQGSQQGGARRREKDSDCVVL